MQRAYYKSDICKFIAECDNTILDSLSLHHSYSLEELQKNAWVSQMKILKDSLKNFQNGAIFFEFLIPCMGKRADNILIINNIVFIIEFEIGSNSYDNFAKEQVLEHAFDLKNFYKASHNINLIPSP